MNRVSLLVLVLVVWQSPLSARCEEAAPIVLSNDDWPQWRGPWFNGSALQKNLPDRWSQTDNVAWKAELMGESAATPIVAGTQVFLSDVDAARETLFAVCIDRRSGKELWRREVGKTVRQDQRSNYAAPSPSTDGKRVVFFFGNGELAAFDRAGHLLWNRNIQKDYGPFAFNWTFSSTPLLFDGVLYLQVLQRDVPVNGHGASDRENESYLLALSPDTGKTLWRVLRPSEAVAESREAFSSPVPYQYQGRKMLLVAGGDALSAHDLATGKELWQWGTWNPKRIPHWRLVPSPVAGEGIVLACAPKRDPIYAIRANSQGMLDQKAVAWTTADAKDVTSDVPTPAFQDGDFFVLSDLRKAVSRVEAKTGKLKWSVPTPSKTKYEASPLLADGKIYVINLEGEAAVLDAATGKSVSVVSMDKPADNEVVRSSIISAHGQLFIRTTRRLYAVGPVK